MNYLLRQQFFRLLLLVSASTPVIAQSDSQPLSVSISGGYTHFNAGELYDNFNSFSNTLEKNGLSQETILEPASFHSRSTVSLLYDLTDSMAIEIEFSYHSNRMAIQTSDNTLVIRNSIRIRSMYLSVGVQSILYSFSPQFVIKYGFNSGVIYNNYFQEWKYKMLFVPENYDPSKLNNILKNNDHFSLAIEPEISVSWRISPLLLLSAGTSLLICYDNTVSLVNFDSNLKSITEEYYRVNRSSFYPFVKMQIFL